MFLPGVFPGTFNESRFQRSALIFTARTQRVALGWYEGRRWRPPGPSWTQLLVASEAAGPGPAGRRPSSYQPWVKPRVARIYIPAG